MAKKKKGPKSKTDVKLGTETRRKIQWRDIIIGAILGTILSSLAALLLNEWKDTLIQRETAQKVLRYVSNELSHNFSILQIKGATAWDFSIKLPSDKTQLDFGLLFMKLTKFHNLAPEVWGKDFKTLSVLGHDGDAAHTAILNFYDTLKRTEKQEEDILGSIERETKEDTLKGYFNLLHSTYDILRKKLEETMQKISPILSR